MEINNQKQLKKQSSFVSKGWFFFLTDLHEYLSEVEDFISEHHIQFYLKSNFIWSIKHASDNTYRITCLVTIMMLERDKITNAMIERDKIHKIAFW